VYNKELQWTIFCFCRILISRDLVFEWAYTTQGDPAADLRSRSSEAPTSLSPVASTSQVASHQNIMLSRYQTTGLEKSWFFKMKMPSPLSWGIGRAATLLKTLLQYYGKSLEGLPGVAYPGFRDNRSTLNTKTGYKKVSFFYLNQLFYLNQIFSLPMIF